MQPKTYEPKFYTAVLNIELTGGPTSITFIVRAATTAGAVAALTARIKAQIECRPATQEELLRAGQVGAMIVDAYLEAAGLPHPGIIGDPAATAANADTLGLSPIGGAPTPLPEITGLPVAA